MLFVWKMLYNVFILPIVMVLTMLVSVFHPKVRDGVRGRFASLRTLEAYFGNNKGNEPVYWFHAASHGEYEQIRPVVKGLKEIEPQARILVSFFSPSGYNHVNDDLVECKVYLPFDFFWIVRSALQTVRPKKLIFAAYDIWPNLVWTAKAYDINTTLFAARFVEGTKKLSPVFRDFYASVYRSFSDIYTVTESDHDRLLTLLTGPERPVVRAFGNPRYDQVKSHADAFTQEHTESVLNRRKCLIAGSVHREDEDMIRTDVAVLLQAVPDLSLIWVPHEPHEKAVANAEEFFRESGYSTSVMDHKDVENIGDARVIIVGTVGVLAKLYWQGQIAYIGGGFSSGVHNVMEPAIARLPVFFGPRYRESNEAEEMIESSGGFTVANGEELTEGISKLLRNPDALLKASYAATDVIHRNLGSATRIVRGIIKD